ncbi:MAG TPA: PHB depolymerase family esterase [Myxococcaceae bacterium]|nr:PHB depolymerase family esterase [Myxococcaceae bacterium]
MPLRSLVTLLIAVAADACAGRSSVHSLESFEHGSLQSGGRQRTFLYRDPPSTAAGLRPLVIGLHGRLGDGAGQEKLTGFSQLAAREGLALVFPDGLQRSWADARGATPASRDGVDDVAFISGLIDLFVAKHRADPSRVYLMGMSNGGFMTLTAACALSAKVAAAVSVTGLMSTALAGSCHPARPISIAFVLGDADPLVPYRGGELTGGRGTVLSGRASADFWVAANGCSGNPTAEPIPDVDPKDGTQSLRLRWTSCRDGTEVQLVTVSGGGHTWPGGYQYLGEGFIGRTSRDFSANELAWELFRRFSL